MKTNQQINTHCSVGMLLSLLCILCFGHPAFGQTPPTPTPPAKASEDNQSDEKLDATFNPDSPTDPIARNPLAKLQQTDPSGLLRPTADKTVVAAMADYSNRQHRETEIDGYSWQAANLHHRRLLFEDVAIEREAQHRRAGNLAAGLHFVKSLVQLPMRLVSGK